MFGERLKALRKQKGLTQAEISKILNVKTNTYCQYEKNLREPDFKTLLLIADFFMVSLDYLFGRLEIKSYSA